MQTVERHGSFFRFRLRPFDPWEADSKPSELIMERELGFNNVGAAAAFLRNFSSDPFAVRGLQSLLSQLGAGHQFNELAEQWIERLALCLVSGRVRVVEQVPRAPAGDSTEGSASSPPPPLPPPRREAVAPVVQQEAATFSALDGDEEAQAQTLIDAAQSGAPFCEVCARAAAAARGL